MGRGNTKTRFKTPPKQTERNKKINAKFARAHANRRTERLIIFEHAQYYNPDIINDGGVLARSWSNHRYTRGWW